MFRSDSYNRPVFLVKMGRVCLFSLILCALAACRGPGPIMPGPGRPLTPLRKFTAGYGVADLTPTPGHALAGYGDGARRSRYPFMFGAGLLGRSSLWVRQLLTDDVDSAEDSVGADKQRRSFYLSDADGTHDPLLAKAIVIKPSLDKPLAIVKLDIYSIPRTLNSAVLAELKDLELSEDRLILAASHTHSGPGHYDENDLARMMTSDVYLPSVFNAIKTAAVTAIRSAWKSAKPAKIGMTRLIKRPDYFGSITRPDTPDLTPKTPSEVLALVLRDSQNKCIAAVINDAIPANGLGPENSYFSGDVISAIEREVSQSLDATPPVILLAAPTADRQLDEYGIKHSAGLASCQELAKRYADFVSPAINVTTGHEKIAIASATAQRDFGTPTIFSAAGDRNRFYQAMNSPISEVTSILVLPLNLPVWAFGVIDARIALSWQFQIGWQAQLDSYFDSTTFSAAAIRIAAGAEKIQEDCAIMTVPGNCTQNVTQQLRSMSYKSGQSRCLILSHSNGSFFDVVDEKTYVDSERSHRLEFYGPEAQNTLQELVKSCWERTQK